MYTANCGNQPIYIFEEERHMRTNSDKGEGTGTIDLKGNTTFTELTLLRF